MNIEQFKRLNKRKQLQLLRSEGIFLLRRSSILYDFLLYQLEGFYIEVMYNVEEKQVLHVEAFSNLKLLAPYLHKIDISALQTD